MPFPNELLQQATAFSSKLGAGILIFAAFWLGSLVLKKVVCALGRGGDTSRQDLINLVGQIAKSALLTFGVVTALGTAGVNVSALVAGLGLTGFALGFAFRDALSNVLAGFLIMFYRPFRRGERIAVVGCEGVVSKIDLRYTTLEGDQAQYLIPNSTLFTNTISLHRKPKDAAHPVAFTSVRGP